MSVPYSEGKNHFTEEEGEEASFMRVSWDSRASRPRALITVSIPVGNEWHG